MLTVIYCNGNASVNILKHTAFPIVDDELPLVSHTNAFIEFHVGNEPTLMDIFRTCPLQCVGAVTFKNVDGDIAYCIFCVSL